MRSIKVLAEAHDEKRNAWSKLILFVDNDGLTREWICWLNCWLKDYCGCSGWPIWACATLRLMVSVRRCALICNSATTAAD